MAYRFTEKESMKQQQNAYALYMILGSYFNKSICANKLQETTLFLYYQELPAVKQEKLEAKLIAAVEKQLEEILPVISKMNCKVDILRCGKEYHLFFRTGFETVSVVVDQKGNYQIQVIEEYDSKITNRGKKAALLAA